jgi:hypothetical protein
LSSTSQDYEPTSVVATADTGPPYRITATKLYREYAANEVLTDRQIAGRPVEVSGFINSIDKDFLDHAVLQLSTGDLFSTVGLTLTDDQKARAATLVKGQPITVICTKMRRIVDSPMGDECRIVESALRAAAPAEQVESQAPTTASDEQSQTPRPQSEAGQQAAAPSEAGTAGSNQAPESAAQTQSGVSPSFNCGMARSQTEKLICSDSELAGLDNELEALYIKARAAAPDKAAFIRDSTAAWHRREDTCSDKPCLVEWYAERRRQLASVIESASSGGGSR